MTDPHTQSVEYELFELMRAAEFDGPVWNVLSERLDRHGMAVLGPWIRSGWIFAAAAEKGVVLDPSEDERGAVTGSEQDLLTESVRLALPRFRRRAAAGDGWCGDPAQPLAACFADDCVLAFAEVFRRARTEGDRIHPALPRTEHTSTALVPLTEETAALLPRLTELLDRCSLNDVAYDSQEFAARLNRLFDPGGHGHRVRTNSEVAAAVTAAGHPISKPYLSQLRAGGGPRPSDATIAALARYFRVRPGYFTDPGHVEAVTNDHALLHRLKFPGLRRLALLAFDLSEESQLLLIAMAARLRVTEALPEISE